MNRQAIEIYFAQVRDALQRLEFGYYHRQMFESGKRRIGGIAHVELVDRGLSSHTDLWSARRAYEVHLQQGRKRSLLKLQRQLLGHIADVEWETKLMKVEIDHGLGRDRERLGFTGDAQRTAVDHHLEQRLHEDVHVCRQIGDEGDGEFEVFEPMLLI
jgi:hypothetical protein